MAQLGECGRVAAAHAHRDPRLRQGRIRFRRLRVGQEQPVDLGRDRPRANLDAPGRPLALPHVPGEQDGGEQAAALLVSIGFGSGDDKIVDAPAQVRVDVAVLFGAVEGEGEGRRRVGVQACLNDGVSVGRCRDRAVSSPPTSRR